MAKPLRDNVQRNLPNHEPMTRSTVPQTMSSCTSLTSPWRLLIETRPLDAIPDVPQRRPHGQRHHLVPRRPVRRPVREELHQILMQPDGPSLMGLRLPDQQRRRLTRVVEIPPLEFQDLGDPQTGAPHDERSSAGLVPVMGRQRVQQTAHLVGSPVMGNIHHGRIHLYELCQKEAT